MTLEELAFSLIVLKERLAGHGRVYAAWAPERYAGYTLEENLKAAREGNYWIPYYPLEKKDVDSLIVKQAKKDRNVLRSVSFWYPYPPLDEEYVNELVARKAKHDAWLAANLPEVNNTDDIQADDPEHDYDLVAANKTRLLEESYVFLLRNYFDKEETEKEVFTELFNIATSKLGIEHLIIRQHLIALGNVERSDQSLISISDQKAAFVVSCNQIVQYTRCLREGLCEQKELELSVQWWLHDIIPKIYNFMVVNHHITKNANVNKQCAILQRIMVRRFRENSDNDVFQKMLVAAMECDQTTDFAPKFQNQYPPEMTLDECRQNAIHDITDGINHVRTGIPLLSPNSCFQWWMLNIFPRIMKILQEC